MSSVPNLSQLFCVELDTSPEGGGGGGPPKGYERKLGEGGESKIANFGIRILWKIGRALGGERWWIRVAS